MTAPAPFYEELGFDQTNPLVWLTQNPTLESDIQRLTGLMFFEIDELQWNDAYYEGKQPLSYLSRAMQTEVGSILRTVVLNWCRLVVDAYVARMTVDGFRFAGNQFVDDDLWTAWQGSGLDRLSKQAFTESLALKKSYMIVGAGDKPGDDPIVTVESPFQVSVVRDPRTRKIIEGLKRWVDLDRKRYSTLYQANRTVTCVEDGGHWVPVSVDNHMLGVPPIVELVNRPRILRPNGVSEFEDVKPIVDAAIKAATDMMVAAEYHAMPRRWVTGINKEDFTDQNGNKVSPWSRVAGRVWSMTSKEAKVGQFDEAALSNFHETIKLLAQLASQVAALPANYLAFNNVNPTSADAMRAIDAQLELRIKAKQIEFGESLEDVMRLVLRFKTGSWDPQAESLETMWTDPGTPTTAQKADAITKLVATGVLPSDMEQAREDLGYTPTQRKRMAEADAKAKVEAEAQAAKDLAAQKELMAAKPVAVAANAPAEPAPLV